MVVAETYTQYLPIVVGTLPTKTLGIDFSKYQGDIDLSVADGAGAKYYICRCGGGYKDSGTPFTDDLWVTNHTKLVDQPRPWTAYWYFIPKNVKAQADRLIELVQYTDYWMPVMIDCEKWWDQQPVGLSPKQASDALEQMLDQLTLAGIETAIYTRGSFWNPYYEARSEFWTRDLWVARYSNTLNHPWGDGYYQPEGWEDWRFWQWSADGNGLGHQFGAESNSIDLDYFNGDESAFDAWVGIPSEYPFVVQVVNTLGALVREMPDAGVYLRVYPCMSLVGVDGIGEDDDGNVWYAIGDGFIKASDVKRI